MKVAYKTKNDGTITNLRFVTSDYVAEVDETILISSVLPSAESIEDIQTIRDRKEEEIRQERNLKLTSSDWTQIPDVTPRTLTAQNVTDYATYRTELCDMMVTVSSELSAIVNKDLIKIYSPTWPTEPVV